MNIDAQMDTMLLVPALCTPPLTSCFPSTSRVAAIVSLLFHPFVYSTTTECAFHATLLSERREYISEWKKQLCLEAF